jgi:hypothetical protein
MRAHAIAALRQLSSSYIRDRRASGEIRGRIVAAAHERSRLLRGAELHAHTELTQRKLAEIEDVRIALERSARAADDRLRAVEAVIASVVTEGAGLPLTPPAGGLPPLQAPQPVMAPSPLLQAPARRPHPSRLRPRAPRPSADGPDEPLRGGWSRPAGTD